MLVPNIRTSRLELISCSPAFMQAALQGTPMPVDYQLPSDFPGDLTGLLHRRLVQLEKTPLEQPFLVRNIVFDGQMIGVIGFHAKPSFAGRLEVGYTIFSDFRRQGFAFEALKALFDWARLEPEISVLHEPGRSVLHEPGRSVLHEPGVNTFVASVCPTNVASLALIAKFGFVQVGRQWDEEDGEELVFELPA